MSWISVRNNVITISVITLVFLLGLMNSNFAGILMRGIAGTSITIGHILAAGQAYVAYVLWNKYI